MRVFTAPALGVLACLLLVAPAEAGAGRRGANEGTIVFVSDRGGSKALYGIAPSSGAISRLAGPEADSPVTAPSAGALAYQAFARGIFTTVVLRPGTPAVRLERCDSPLSTPSWAPDGRRLACSGTDRTIEIFAANGTDRREVARGVFQAPAWSPDGRWIAYAGGCDRCRDAGLWIAPATGGRPRRLLAAGVDSGLSWSPDSARLAFTELTPDFSTERLFVTDLRGRTRRLGSGAFVDNSDDSHTYLTPSWSPDGRAIAMNAVHGIELVDTATGAERSLTRDRGQAPVWSPDGAEISYERPRAGSDEFDIAVVHADESGRRVLTHWFPDGGSNTSPTWSTAALVHAVQQPVQRTAPLPGGRELSLRTPITLLAVDGARAAFTSGDCTTRMWAPDGRSSPIDTCYNPDGSYAVTRFLALAGRSLVWAVDDETIDQYEYLLAAAPPYRQHTQVAFLYSDDQGGDEATRLIAARTSAAFEVDSSDTTGAVAVRHNWILDLSRLDGGVRCPDDGSDTGLVSARGCRLLAPAPHARLLALGSSRIVEGTADGRLLVTTLSGKPIRSWRLPSGYPRSASLDGGAVDVLNGVVLRRYDIASGRLAVRLRIAAALEPATLVGAAPGLVAYRCGATLHLVRLHDGADITLLPPSQGDDNLLAQLDDAGLFYAYDRAGGGMRARVDFVPLAALRPLFSRASELYSR